MELVRMSLNKPEMDVNLNLNQTKSVCLSKHNSPVGLVITSTNMCESKV